MNSSNVEVDFNLLLDLCNLQEFWFNRALKPGMSESDYKIWHATGYGSNSHKKLCAIIREKLNKWQSSAH